jgi:hypothetical protein
MRAARFGSGALSILIAGNSRPVYAEEDSAAAAPAAPAAAGETEEDGGQVHSIFTNRLFK